MASEKGARASVAVFDLDGTITNCDTYVSFLKLCIRRQPGRIIRSLHLPFAVAMHKAGVVDNAWLKETFLSAIVGGVSAAQLQDLTTAHAANIMRNHLRPGALQAIESHRAAGHRLLLATASFDFYANILGANLGFEKVVCTRARLGNNREITGKIDGVNCYGNAKVDAVLKAIPDRQKCTLTAYSDHHSDWALLQESDIPMAINPTAKLLRLARANQVNVKMW